MKEKHGPPVGKEFPRAHLIHTILPIIFTIIWMLDTFIFQFSTGLNLFIPEVIRIILFIITLIISFTLMRLVIKALFQGKQETPTLITNGIFAHVRHPMYLGVLLIYIAFIFLSISIICIILWIFILIPYNIMATYEEKDLEKIFGEEYLKYKNKVPKWIPR